MHFHTLIARASCYAVIALGSACPAIAHAASDEIVVFTDELEKKGEVGFELHLNYATRARKTPDYPSEQPPYRVFRVMPEVVWGFAYKWNLGVHVPFSYNVNTRATTIDGAKVRVHYLNVMDHSPDNATFYGGNFEVALYHKRITESRYNGEIRGILGQRQGNWKYSINTLLNQRFNKNPEGRPVELEMFGQVLRSFGEDFAMGVEHYASFDRLSNPTFGSQSGQTSYLVMDFKTKRHFDIHVGIGHGWTDAVDKRVLKALVGIPF